MTIDEIREKLNRDEYFIADRTALAFLLSRVEELQAALLKMGNGHDWHGHLEATETALSAAEAESSRLRAALVEVLKVLRKKWRDDVDGQWDGAHMEIAQGLAALRPARQDTKP